MKNNYSIVKLSSITIALLLVFSIFIWCIFTFTAHADGTGWNVVPGANASPVNNSLQSIAALSHNKVWAVGYSVQGTTKSTIVKRTLIERYNGTAWQAVASPNVGTGDNVLTGVATIAENNVWAVGSTPQGALILHYNGAGWHVVSTPTSCQLHAVTAINTNDVWAVGSMGYQSCAEHFNGRNWSLSATPNLGTSDNTLLGASASSSHDVWAVGNYCVGTGCDRGGGSFHTLILHYTGAHWNAVASPNPSSYANQLNAVTALSANNVWAVGATFTNPLTGSTLIEHFNGTRWTRIASPGVNTRSILTAITPASATNISAVGFSVSPKQGIVTLIEHFNGTTWSIVASPSPGKNAMLSGVAHIPGTTRWWAVGSYSTSTSGSTLIERNG